MGSMALLPDGSSDPRVVYDYYSFSDIAVAAAGTSFNLNIVAGYPWNAAVKLNSGKLTVVPMLSDNLNVAASSLNSVTNRWCPCNFTVGAQSQYYLDKISSINGQQIVTADRQRITSLGWRLTYTGPVSTAAGIVTVTSSPQGTEPMFPKNKGRIQWVDNNNSTGGVYDCGTGALNVVGIALPQSVPQKDAVMARPEKTLQGIVRKNSPIFKWLNWSNTGFWPIALDPGTDVLTGNVNCLVAGRFDPSGTYTFNSTTNTGSLNLFDEDWDIPTINVTGCNADATYRLETWMCMEYVPINNSVYYSLAKRDTTGTVETVSKLEKITNDKPVAETSTSTSK